LEIGSQSEILNISKIPLPTQLCTKPKSLLYETSSYNNFKNSSLVPSFRGIKTIDEI
jgi:hypothetical protein